MEIKEFIIHQIDKLAHKEPKVQLRDTTLKVTDSRVQKFTTVAIDVFKANEEKPSSVFADFNKDTENYPFSDWCKRYFCKTTSFVKFTKDATNRLAAHMKAQQASTGGFVVFAIFQAEGETKLLVCMLHPQDGLSITSKLEFEDVTHLELKHIDKAALITAPKNGTFGDKPLTYAGFRKEMSQYFQEFIGPDAFRNPRKDSSELIDRLEDYARQNSFDEARLDSLRVRIRKYAHTCAKDGTELDLAAISAMVDPAKRNAFAMYAANAGVSAFIKPDPTVFKKWKVIKHKSEDGLVLQFKAEMVGLPGTSHRLELDANAKTLTIKNVEQDLIDKIKAAKA